MARALSPPRNRHDSIRSFFMGMARQDDEVFRHPPLPQTETCGGGGFGTLDSGTDRVLRRGREWRNVAGVILKKLCH